MEIYEHSEKDFKIIILKKFNEIQETTDRQFTKIRKAIHKQNEKFSKAIDKIKKKQTEIL
jgi:hypothetical protein